uniref:Methylenetetrahydrofolate reductase n=1 Tax=Macrostomum lignano TaxID=282301 RepID=A0A1I8JPP0_9PLAT
MPENSSSALPRCRLKRSSSQEEQERPQPQPAASTARWPPASAAALREGPALVLLRVLPAAHPGGRCEPRLQVRQLRQGPAAVLRRHLAPAGNPAGDSPTSSTSSPASLPLRQVASAMLNYCGIDTVLHLTCVGQTEARLVRVLDRAKSPLGLKNILALRGDLPKTPTATQAAPQPRPAEARPSPATCFFCIGVAGYRGGPPGGRQLREDLRRLKEKVGGGFCAEHMAEWTPAAIHHHAAVLRFGRLHPLRVRLPAVGIDCPIIPGVLPVQGYQSLRHIVKLSKLTVPDSSMLRCTQMCQELLQSGQVPRHSLLHAEPGRGDHPHFEKHRALREDLPRPLPWQPSANYERCAEAVRPVFWSRRPTSYVHRTRHWDDYPTAASRSGSACGAASQQQRAGHLAGVRQPPVRETSQPGRCPSHPAALGDEEPLPSSSESNEAAEARQRLAATTRCTAGGGSGGFVYQRAYLEFFLPGRRLPALQSALSSHGGGRVSFHIADRSGNVNLANFSEPIALTWGVFPASEVAQPTVCDGAAFLAWRDEAFALWTEEWGRLYEEGSPSRRLIESVAETYLLVALVDNDFTEDSVLWDLTDQVARAADGSDENLTHSNRTPETQLSYKRRSSRCSSFKPIKGAHKMIGSNVGVSPDYQERRSGRGHPVAITCADSPSRFVRQPVAEGGWPTSTAPLACSLKCSMAR